MALFGPGTYTTASNSAPDPPETIMSNSSVSSSSSSILPKNVFSNDNSTGTTSSGGMMTVVSSSSPSRIISTSVTPIVTVSASSISATTATPNTTTSDVSDITQQQLNTTAVQQPSTKRKFEELLQLKPYSFETTTTCPTDVLQLWNEVGFNIDNNQTVVWKSAVDALDHGLNYLTFSAESRQFVEAYTGCIIGILVAQHAGKIGDHERSCVHDSLSSACLLTAKDLAIQIDRGVLAECLLLDTTLRNVFNTKNAYYEVSNGQVAFPEVRIQKIERFRSDGGFKLLTQYLEEKVEYQQYYNSIMFVSGAVPQRIPQSLIHPSTLFPKVDTLYQILQALCDTIDSRVNNTSTTTIVSEHQVANQPGAINGNQSPIAAATTVGATTTTITTVITITKTTKTKTTTANGRTIVAGGIPPQQVDTAREDDAVVMAAAVMKYLHNITEDELQKIPPKQLSTIVQHGLQRLFDKLITTRRLDTYEFYSFWRALILKLISSSSLPLKLFGWEQVSKLIDACADHAPPPRQYVVRGAGTTFANGVYLYAGQITPDGYAKHGSVVLYSYTIPPVPPTTTSSSISNATQSSKGDNPSETPTSSTSTGTVTPGSPGKKLTLFRCTMRSQKKWWFISEADKEQPRTDRDVDYYQHKSKERDESLPPRSGWMTCLSAGTYPPPTLEPQGLMVPNGKENETLGHLLAKWAIENDVLLVADSTIHGEIGTRSTVLINFLASMCSKDDNVLPSQNQLFGEASM